MKWQWSQADAARLFQPTTTCWTNWLLNRSYCHIAAQCAPMDAAIACNATRWFRASSGRNGKNRIIFHGSLPQFLMPKTLRKDLMTIPSMPHGHG